MRALYPLSLIYSFLYKLDRSFSKTKKLHKPVISVGNITLGGTGKTSIVIELLKLLVKNELNPTVLTRGYLRKTKKPVILKNGVINVDVSVSGDEPMLIAKTVPGASVIVGADRYANAIKFANKHNTDVYVLDDGFQHWSIKRDLDIVCINAFNPFGNDMLIPAGILREPVNALRRADIVILTNSDMINQTKLENLQSKILNLTGKAPIVTCYSSFEYKTLDLKTDFDIKVLNEMSLCSLSAVGFTSGFKNSILKSGLKIKGSIILRDHSNFDNKFLNNIVNKKYRNTYFIVTAKDAVKFENIDESIKKKVIVLKVLPKFITGKNQWKKSILNILQSF
ncbi:MAG: tetraacyldisaccharide 4'-kinase [Endomicrobium sp.]|jgi:tetraacyldisaccharide 4'-kinase|nr:tetraacyldisaccharide 4'-kinase [Endomicrobium sp.]